MAHLIVDGKTVEKYFDITTPLSATKQFVSEMYGEDAQFSIKPTRQEIIEFRQKAYKKESDPLYMEYQFDNTPESGQAWRDKVAEIKVRYPLPEAQ